MPRVLYRLLTSNPPTLEDFMSYAAQGKTPPEDVRDDPSFLHRWNGLSMYDTYRAARRAAKARRFRRWAYIAEVHIPDESPISFEGPDGEGHWNVYGADPMFLKEACTVHILHAPSVEEWPSRC